MGGLLEKLKELHGSTLKELTGPAGVEAWDADPESIGFRLDQFIEDFGMAEGELQSELNSGRLQAVTLKWVDGRPIDPFVTARALEEWTRTPQGHYYMNRWLRSMKGRKP